MKNQFENNWTSGNNGYPLFNEEVEKYISVLPSENQVRLAENCLSFIFHQLEKIAHFFLMFLRRIKVLSIIKMFMHFNLLERESAV